MLNTIIVFSNPKGKQTTVWIQPARDLYSQGRVLLISPTAERLLLLLLLLFYIIIIIIII